MDFKRKWESRYWLIGLLHKSIPTILLLFLLALGTLIFRDYGISTDEAQQRLIGQTSVTYLAHLFNISFLLGNAAPLISPGEVFSGFNDRDYGVAFELPAELLIRALAIKTEAGAYYFRHALTYMVFTGGVSSLYFLIKRRYSSYKLGLLASTILVLTPRIFGDAFFNDKDLVFMSIFVIATNSLICFLENPSLGRALFHSLACGIAIDTRIMAIILPAATLFALLIQVLNGKLVFKKTLIFGLIYLSCLAGFILLLWPWLWLDPVNNFLQAFKSMSKFRWSGMMLFMGDVYTEKYIPWYYIPVWMGITIPPLYLVLFGVGLLSILKKMLQTKYFLWNNFSQLQDVVCLGLFLAPLTAVILLHSVLYNGWRHLYFIYPTFIIITIHGLVILWSWVNSSKLLKSVLIIIIFIQFISTGFWMIRNHPYQYLYFNMFAKKWDQNFDLDYWGVAHLPILKKILSNNPDRKINIFNKMQGPPWAPWQIHYWPNVPLLDEKDRNRLDGSRSESCSDFVITAVPGNAYQYSQKKEFHLIDELKIDGRLIYATYQRKQFLEDLEPKLGVPMQFSNDSTHCFTKSGWNERSEDWGVWSVNKEALIELPLPAGKVSEITLELRAFINSRHPKQTISISANNAAPQIFYLDRFEGNTIKIMLPKMTENERLLQLKLSIPDAASPKSLGLSDDGRLLGVGLVSATFN